MSTAGQVVALVGALLMAVAALGALRFATVFHRMHALSIAGSTAIGAIAVGAILGTGSWRAVPPLVAVIVFQFLTAPVASHLIGRAAHRSVDRVTSTGIDDLERDAPLLDAVDGADGGPVDEEPADGGR